MRTPFVSIAAALTAASLSAVVVVARQPRIENGRITVQAAGSLPSAFKAAAAAHSDVGWIGYAVPIVDAERNMCCFNSGTSWIEGNVVVDGARCCGMCRLERPGEGDASRSAVPPPAGQTQAAIKLEGAREMIVLFRIVEQQVERVRAFSEGCALDAGGRPVTWLTGVRPAESVALLESLTASGQERRDRVTDGAITAIALHADTSADAALERLLAPSQPQSIRAKVPFWLGNARGRRGLDLLQRLVREDGSAEVKKKAVFGISQSAEPGATGILIDNARQHPEATVRGEAIFWLAQKAGQKATAAITERIEQDPDTEVKKRAVFALSQLPKDEGVPLLIQVARKHSNPAVKRQAMFWLGQSKDPRALDFFAEILK
jgi:hypothetical protein